MPNCLYESCKCKGVMITGDCNYCKSNYCNKHRLPETHECSGLQKCKDVHFERNKATLLSNKLTPVKV
jgi:predicted nucleic acid binding AN1-type Zn finger protein